MTSTADSRGRASATLSGKELAMMRRQAMALQGKAAVAKTASYRGQTAAVRTAVNHGLGRADAASYSAALVSGAVHSASAGLSGIGTASVGTTSSTKAANRARREAISRSGKTAQRAVAGSTSATSASTCARRESGRGRAEATNSSAQDCGCGCNGKPGGCADRAAPVSSASKTPAAATTHIDTSSRAFARARRNALAQGGKAGLAAVALATAEASGRGYGTASASALGRTQRSAASASGRQLAMQRRQAQSLTGRDASTKSHAATSARMSARQSARSNPGVAVRTEPAKEEKHPAPSAVTGTINERSLKATGKAAGLNRAVTGTEYVGSEQSLPQRLARQLQARPGSIMSTVVQEKSLTGTQLEHSAKVSGAETGAHIALTGTDYVGNVEGLSVPDKVAVTHTARGKTVTGTALGAAEKVTGDEPGACRSITGTEYLSAEQYQGLCGKSAPTHPHKVSVMSTRKQQTVSGTEVGRSAQVTGDEPGACRQITGSQYYTSSDFESLCHASGPRKVGTALTLAGRTVTGTELGRSPKLTGDERGGCKPVTGTDYISADQLKAMCADSTPVAPIAKVLVDQTWRGQTVTGTQTGRSGKVTGDEPGSCASISGTSYVGRAQYGQFCPAPAAEAQQARSRSSITIPAARLTGDRPGAGGSAMTGDERGACEIVSGTPYVGSDNLPTQCQTSARFLMRQRATERPSAIPVPADFSIQTPARVGRERQSEAVTGMIYNSERITGPANKAAGLITGTPEFRHREADQTRAAQDLAVSAARRLTGEGSQSGAGVTGDAWHALSRVTGTEGASSLARNLSQRGQARGEGLHALQPRKTEAIEVPPSRVTGSSGNTAKGALVTVSGGARA